MKKSQAVEQVVEEEVLTIAPEFISDGDKNLLEQTKLKRELAVEKVKSAIASNENAELQYNNIILQLAIKYSLKEGDIIGEDGMIKRKQ